MERLSPTARPKKWPTGSKRSEGTMKGGEWHGRVALFDKQGRSNPKSGVYDMGKRVSD